MLKKDKVVIILTEAQETQAEGAVLQKWFVSMVHH